MVHTRLHPPDIYSPRRYSQVVTSTGVTQWHIAGTVGFNQDRELVSLTDMRAQAVCVMDNGCQALAAVGAAPAHVVRLNVYTTDMDRFRANAGAVVFGFFGNTRPASTLVAVTQLADPRYVLDVEATAVAHHPAA